MRSSTASAARLRRKRMLPQRRQQPRRISDAVGWAKALLRRAHHHEFIWKWWARFALPTLRILTAAIGRITPRRHEQRHVKVAFRLAHRKAQRNLVEKRRIGHRH